MFKGKRHQEHYHTDKGMSNIIKFLYNNRRISRRNFTGDLL